MRQKISVSPESNFDRFLESDISQDRNKNINEVTSEGLWLLKEEEALSVLKTAIREVML